MEKGQIEMETGLFCTGRKITRLTNGRWSGEIQQQGSTVYMWSSAKKTAGLQTVVRGIYQFIQNRRCKKKKRKVRRRDFFGEKMRD